MNKVIISKEVDPAYNLALEEELLRNLKDNENILYLWQNDRTVVIGRNQNPYSECNLDYMKENNITLVRRISGGGTVFHDLGNLNFTFLTKEVDVNLEKQLKVIIDGIKKLGLVAEISGRNDLLIDNKKFSGHAFYSEDGNYFHHGTIMIDINLNELSKALNPSKLKLQSKGIKSVRSRVINLKDLDETIDSNSVKDALINGFLKVYGEVSNIKEYSKEEYIPSYFQKYNDRKWNFGESPNYNITLERKFSIGNVEINLDIVNGIIEDCKIFTDSLMLVDLNKIQECLKGIEFNEEVVIKIIEGYM
ncbi:TPA: lipoate--protein ligase [Clostridium botulinum]|nr:lipoate--protein ligase [Clostridium botulinum]